MMMNNLKWAIAAGSAAIALTALPAQAAMIRSTTTDSLGGTIAASAYRIENLLVDGTAYDVQFDYGSFYGIYGNPPAASVYAGAFAGTMGNAIVAALQANSIQQIINTTFSSGTLTEFYIPESPNGMNSNQHLLAHCFTTKASPSCDGNNRDPGQNDSVLFARFNQVASSPTPVPTPALLPGLLGMGAAVLRRRKQAAEEIAA